MSYVCVKCGNVFEKLYEEVRCPKCAFRVVKKKRPEIAKEVEAI